MKNRDEADADCGGKTCPKCANGKVCSFAAEYISGECIARTFVNVSNLLIHFPKQDLGKVTIRNGWLRKRSKKQGFRNNVKCINHKKTGLSYPFL